MDYSVPSRGEIYDRDGDVLAAQSDAYAFHIIPGNVTEDSLGTLLSEVSKLCGISPETVWPKRSAIPRTSFPIPLCEASGQESERIRSVSPSGLLWTEYNSRYYFEQGVGSNIVGYTQSISEEDMEEYRRLGYRSDERVGATGSKDGRRIILPVSMAAHSMWSNPTTGTPVTKVGESQPKPADSVYLTIDRICSIIPRKPLKDLRARWSYWNAIRGVCLPWLPHPVSIRIYFHQTTQMVKPVVKNYSKGRIIHWSTAQHRDNIHSARYSRSSPWLLAWKAAYMYPKQPGIASMIAPNCPIRSVMIGPGIIAREGYRQGMNAIPPIVSLPAC